MSYQDVRHWYEDPPDEADMRDMEIKAAKDHLKALTGFDADEALETMKAALKETGCDGDLCAHNWHEEFRKIIRSVEPNWSAR